MAAPVDDAPVEPEPLVPGVARALSPLARRILAHNPGRMTGPGTNTYLVGIDEIVVIDPGPEDDEHLDAICGCGGDRIRWIALTHTHPDHAPSALALKQRTGAELLAFNARDGIKPDRRIGDGFTIEATEFRLTAVHTPGHASNHLCYLLEEERLLFSGDHLMEGSTVVIRPPDGDMVAYLASLEKVRKLRLRAIAPGHGRVIEQPNEVIDWYLAHRHEREAAVLAALREAGTAKVDDLLPVVYADVDAELLPVARYSLHAHLLKLAGEGRAAGRTLTGKWTAT
ncbi:MAG: MBL fold metallo-hydrolase [Acidimicrobiales bacterium]|nr:MBL fold metallo-hydrolase [Acidimicrobiales bacterium]